MTTTWRVLFIDNNEIDLIAFRRYLAGKCDIETAQSYDEGLQKFAAEKFDCIVLDYELGNQTGLALLQELINKYNNKLPPAILITGQGNEEVASTAIKMGVSDYLIKSRVTESALFRSINNAIIQYRLQEDIKLKNRELRRMVKQLELAYRNIQQLHHILSHELKTPLMALREFILLFSEGVFGATNEKQREILKLCKECTEAMKLYINDLSDISLIESKKLVLDTIRSNITPIIEEVIQITKEKANEKNLQINTEIKKDIPEIMVDKNRLRQALINLVNNAIKFTPESGKIFIKVTTDNKYLIISIADTGSGIPKNEMKKIFHAYYQSKNSNKNSNSGLGLGLRICQGIIEAHGGVIDVVSELNVGTTFFVKLPLSNKVDSL